MAKRRGANDGSIYQRPDGRWAATVETGYVDGKRRRKYLYGDTRQEVQKKLGKARRQVEAGIPLPDDRLTVGAFLATWLEQTAKPTVRPLTYVGYEEVVRLHLAPTLGNVRLAKLKPEQVEDLLNRKTDDGLSATRVRYILGLLRRALKVAERRGYVARNVATLVAAPRVARAEVQVLNPEEVKRLLAAARNHRLSGVFTLAVSTGLRRGELFGLRWEDVDLDKGTLKVRHSLQRITGRGLVLTEPKSATSRRTINLPLVAAQALREQRLRQKQEERWGAPTWQDSGHVFTTTVGTPYPSNEISGVLKGLLKKAGLPSSVRFHDLRHCCASLLLAQGVQPRMVMEILGHSNIGITMNLYTHILPALRQDAAAKMDAALEA